MEKINKQQVRNQFALLCDFLGVKPAAYDATIGPDGQPVGFRVGDLSLDDLGCYGGFNIEVVTDKTGHNSHPFGHTRRKNREMSEFLYSVREFLLFLGLYSRPVSRPAVCEDHKRAIWATILAACPADILRAEFEKMTASPAASPAAVSDKAAHNGE